MLGCPKLTPLQARFAASVGALALIGLIYWSLSNPHFAYAAELAVDGAGTSRNGEDHNWHRIAEERLREDGLDVEWYDKELTARKTASAAARAAAPSAIGGNNVPSNDNIQSSSTTVWMYSKDLLFGPFTAKGPGLPADVEDDMEAREQHSELRKRSSDDGGNQLEQRQSDKSRKIYVSINTCLQPDWVGPGTQSSAAPQLILYVSTDSSNQDPGPDGDSSTQEEITLSGGFANTTIQATGDWYMSVHAPSLPADFSGVWNYELAVSIDDFYHSASPTTPNLYLIDSDTDSALLVTDNLTQADPGTPSYDKWVALSSPYTIFASNENHTAAMGLHSSFCGLSKTSQIVGDQLGGSTQVQTEMTTRGLGNKPKEQFYITALNGSSTYTASLALNGNSTASGAGVVGGGGSVWAPVHFGTKSDGNCALLFNLSFCSEVAYAVPSTPSFVANFTAFRQFYDNYTLYYYQQFNYSLQQIPCDTTADAQYSLARNCDDCAKAYKQWLCAVSVPRCADYSSTAPWLQPRNMAQAFFNNGSLLPENVLSAQYIPMPDAPTLDGTPAFSQTFESSLATNSSRNVQIDQVIAPGPYKEVLPCEDLCYNLALSCPAALSFSCPYRGKGLEAGYGIRSNVEDGAITCSYLGAYVSVNAAADWGMGGVVGRAVGFAFILVAWLVMHS